MRFFIFISLFCLSCFTLLANDKPSPTATSIVGTWLSKAKDLKVEICQKDAVTVKGYLGFEIIGKNLEFTRVKN